MELSAAEGRVLGCLILKQEPGPEAEPLSLDVIRFGCNQSYGSPFVAVDDRTVDDALVSLKSKGLARFLQAGRNVGPVRYRHRAEERWRLGPGELAVLAVLLLGGPQSVDEVRAAVAAHALPDRDATIDVAADIDVEAMLDALGGRTPRAFATRVAPTGWGGAPLWAEILTGMPTTDALHQAYDRLERQPPPPPPERRPDQRPPAAGGSSGSAPGDVADRLSRIERRLAGIEAALNALRTNPPPAAPEGRPPVDRPPYRSAQESSRVIR